MSLARAIIYGGIGEVKAQLEAGAILNEVDEYGYTPLIQCAIINDIEKAKLILAAGADVNFTDLTGRSALHWATDNNSLELTKLLLENGADANGYSRVGQPVLTMPYLRGQEQMKNLLYQHGAKRAFAQDYINAKLIGHRYELEGRVDIVDTNNTFLEVDLEGFYLEFSLAIVAQSLRDFKNHFAGKHLKSYFDKVDIILQTLNTAAELIKYQHYLVDVRQFEDKIDQLLNQYPLLIPTVYHGHAISLIAFGSILIRCDRGEFGRKHGTVIFYHLKHPERINKNLVKQIIYTRQHPEFIDGELLAHLGANKVDTMPITEQITGNCSWANVEAVVPSMLYALLLQQKNADQASCLSQAMHFYEQWLSWDKQRAMTFCIQSFHRVGKARKASKLALMFAIVFQTYDFEDPECRIKAERIFRLVQQYPEYMFIPRAYSEVFQYDRDNPMYKSFAKFLDYFEIEHT